MQKLTIKQKILLLLFGLFLFAVLLEAELRIAGFVILSFQEARNRASLQRKGAYRILCLGESTTAWGDEYSYPSQLEEILNRQDIGIKFSVINKGIGGTRTTAIVLGLEDNLAKYQPDMVITMMGINDRPVIYKDLNEIVKTYSEEGYIPKSEPFFKSLRIYKLARFLQQHIAHKIREVLAYTAIKLRKISDSEKCYQLGRYYEERGRYEQARAMFEESLELDPENYERYLDIGNYYMRQGDLKSQKIIFKKAIELNPLDSRGYLELARAYLIWRVDAPSQSLHLHYLTMAEEMLKKAVQVEPNNLELYAELGGFYGILNRWDEFEMWHKKALEINPRYAGAYIGLGQLYMDRGQYDLAKEMFKKAQAIEPNVLVGDYQYLESLRHNAKKGDFSELEAEFRKASEMDIVDERLLGYMALCYTLQKKHKLAERYFEKVDKLRLRRYNTTTYYNYLKLKDILKKRGIKLVCVQYPMRSIASLRNILGQADGVMFVDNERIFKEKVAKEGYDAYFTDIIGGDFGHCTEKGNRLLAENIARVILSEIKINKPLRTH